MPRTKNSKKTAQPSKKPSTALAVRKKPIVPEVLINDPQGLLKSAQTVGQLGELATVGTLGLVELRLTDAEEGVLARPVNPSDILVRDGGIAYLPHIVYTRWFNEAFGRTGWALVPTDAPRKVDNLIIVTYLLYVHGVPVAQAKGEHEYQETNRRQTYGDVIESTVASALRRCAKRLGVGLEMWDKRWLEANVGRRNTRTAERGDFIDAQPIQRESQPSAKITKAQQQKLWNAARKRGRIDADVALWLKHVYQVTKTEDLKQSDFAAIIAALESSSDLPLPGDGE